VTHFHLRLPRASEILPLHKVRYPDVSEHPIWSRMMFRSINVVVCLLGIAVATWGDDKDKDPIREKLFAAKVAYEKEMSRVRMQVDDWFDKREEAARKKGDKKALDQAKADRKTFEEDGELPKTGASTLVLKRERAKKAMETAYSDAVKAYTKAKKDDEAAAVE